MVDGPEESTRGTFLNGKKYDFVFEVDVEDGAPRKKLPYNLGENPYDVADRFLIDENLPTSYR